MSEETPDMFPETLPIEVEVTGNGHKHGIGEFYGAAKVMDALEAVPENRRAPGFSHALAIAQSVLSDLKADLMGQNLRAIAAAGHDITNVKNVALKGQVLICTPYAPGDLT